MSESENGDRYREEGWYIMGSVSAGFFVWMGLWDTFGVVNAAFLGFATLSITYTIASAPRSLHTGSEYGLEEDDG